MPKEPTKTAPARPRLDAEDFFRFRCAPGIACFTQCCQDVTIVLTPYDLLRMKQAAGMSSGEFIDRHALLIPKKNRLLPLVVLRMEEEDKRCPFVTKDGCSIYPHRPWACRMFPLDLNDDGTFSVISDASRCMGLSVEEMQRVGEWLLEQGVPIYDEMNQRFSQVTAPLAAQDLDIDNPQIEQMVFMATYNLDRFRDFIFQSSFLERFALEPAQVEKIKRSDIELLKFGFDWIKFGLFGQKLFKVKASAVPGPQDASSPGEQGGR